MGKRSNPYFHFQQFSIWQDRCAMKVGVDGVLLGAWADVTESNRILDVGTGTGLIALMIAQRAPNSEITALEIDPEASQQAQENVARSPWQDRIKIHTVRFQDYLNQQIFDLVISNPPYFAGMDQSNPRAIARQQGSLSASTIIETIRPHLSAAGKLAMIIPFEQDLEAIASAQGLYLHRKTNIKPTPTKPCKRSLVEFRLTQTTPTLTEMTIERTRHDYTPEYQALLSEFSLKKF